MTTAMNNPRFDIEAVRELAGDKVFTRGEDYHRNRQVQILAVETGCVRALVMGTEDYRTVLELRGKEISGECSCPAFRDYGFCKHMVATALCANEMDASGLAQAGGALSRIRTHLKSRGVDALVELVMDLAGRDPTLFRKLDIAAIPAVCDEKALAARMRKAIDGAVRTRGFVEYREAAGWAAGVAETLEAVAGLVAGGRASLAIGLVEHAMDLIERSMENIDDSDGHCGALLEQAQDIHLHACQMAKPDRIELARNLFRREMESDFDVFRGAATIYAAVLGEEGLAEYRRLAVKAWDKLPARNGQVRAQENGGLDRFRLMGTLDFFYEREGNLEARIAIRAKDLSSQWNYVQLAEFCREHGRGDEALRRAEEGLWMFEDDKPDERLVFLTVDVLLDSRRQNDAEALLWRAFERAPSFSLYQCLRKLGGAKARERMVAHLKAQAAKEAPSKWHAPGDLLVRVLMEERMFDAAWAALREHKASWQLAQYLAMASEKTHRSDALVVYAGRIDELVNLGGNRGYEDAAKLVARMGGLRTEAEQFAYIAGLKLRFKAKRNFMKLLG
jgi:hypothetical protein